MKKFALVVLVALVGMSASAQKGQTALGLSFGLAPCIAGGGTSVKNFGIAAKLQYGLTDKFRGELGLGYDFKDFGFGLFHATANFHYMFDVAEKISVYPIVGIGYGRMVNDWIDLNDYFDDFYHDYGYYDDCGDYGYETPSMNRFIVQCGIGGEYYINEHFAVNAEAKFQYIKDFKRIPISIGFAYLF